MGLNLLDNCTGVARGLLRLAAIGGQSIEGLRDARDHAPTGWFGALDARCAPVLRSCAEAAAALSGPELDSRELRDFLTVASEAFAAESLRREPPSLCAVSLLFARLFQCLHAGFGFCHDLAERHGFTLLAERCAVLAAPLARLARSAPPYPPPAAYGESLARFVQLSANVDPLEAIPALERAYEPPDQPPSRALRETPRHGPGKEHEPKAALQETVVLRPEVLADVEGATDRVCRVWFATDRAPHRPSDPAEGFSAHFDPTLHFGSCLVFVPRSHLIGSLGSNWVVRTLLLRSDDRLGLDLIAPASQSEFQQGVAAELARRRTSSVLIYVHGFNVSFEEAARRAAQLACDLSMDSVCTFFSWPSAGKLRAYARDEESIRLCVDHFLAFLDTLRAVSGVEVVHVLAHSLGNRLLAMVQERLALQSLQVPFGHLILAAPDIGRAEFDRVCAQYPAQAKGRTTLYSCARDRALALSTRIHDYLRVGYEPPVYCRAGIDTVSTTAVKPGVLGHGLVFSARAVLTDVKKVLCENLPPSARALTPIPDAETPEYWLLPKENHP